MSIQGIKKNKIFIIGTPRFESYFGQKNRKINNNFNYKYILFLESSCRYLSETELVPLINAILEKNKQFKDLKLIYRPHPITISNYVEFKQNFPQQPDPFKTRQAKGNRGMGLHYSRHIYLGT